MGAKEDISNMMKKRHGLEDCVECGETKYHMELGWNSCFTAYGNRRICNKCAAAMTKVKLSKVNMELSTQEVIDWMLDKNYDTIINDLAPPPHIEYDLNDLFTVWTELQTIKPTEE